MSTTIYIAGPMTGLPQYNYPAFFSAAELLESLGFSTRNPAAVEEPEEPSWQAYMKATTRLLTECEGVALLPGWEKSRGARIEKQWAEAVGLTVLTLDQWLHPSHGLSHK